MKNFYENKTNKLSPLWRKAMLTFLIALITLGVSLSLHAQKFEVTGKNVVKGQSAEIGLSGSIDGTFYYLFRIDDMEQYHYVRAQIGQGIPLSFGNNFKETGTYVIYAFDEFKGIPFDFDKYKPTEGIIQSGNVKISTE